MESKEKVSTPASIFVYFQSFWHKRLHHHGASQVLYILFHHHLVLQKTTAFKTTSGHSHGEVPHPTPHTGCGDERSRPHRLPACQVPGRGRMDAETPGEEAGPRPRPHVQTSAQGPRGDTAGDPGPQDAWSSLHPGPCLCCA